jgi:hypothetical protein
VFWEGIENDLCDDLITEPIDLCDWIGIAFVLYLMRTTEVKHLDSACLFDRSDRYWEKLPILVHLSSLILFSCHSELKFKSQTRIIPFFPLKVDNDFIKTI